MENKTIDQIFDEIDNLNIPLKERITKAIIAFILSLALVFGPIALCINLLIYEKLRGLLALGIALMTTLFVFLTLKIYYDSITLKKVKYSNKLLVIPTLITFVLGLGVVLILILVKVI